MGIGGEIYYPCISKYYSIFNILLNKRWAINAINFAQTKQVWQRTGSGKQQFYCFSLPVLHSQQSTKGKALILLATNISVLSHSKAFNNKYLVCFNLIYKLYRHCGQQNKLSSISK